MRQLHLGNIANVAYAYCKLLRAFDRDASVLCYDIDHVFSQPEWYDGDFDSADLDESGFDSSSPRYRACPPPDFYRRIRSVDFFDDIAGSDGPWRINQHWIEALARFSGKYSQRWRLRREDMEAYRLLSEVLGKNFFGDCDVIFGYAHAAVPAMLCSMKPYVAVEIGTMRELPFTDSALGRLLALAYRTAPHVIITNPDVVGAARELGVEHYTFVPHPVDEDVWKPESPDASAGLRAQYGAEHLLLAPARQNWRLKGNDKYLRAFHRLVQDGLDARLIITMWGQEVDRTRRLVHELGISDHVSYLGPLPEKGLLRFYNAADLVLDQFGDCGTFGLITPKAMACGTPVVINYRPELHEWCFPEHPPVVSAFTEEEIYRALKHYLTDSDQRSALAREARRWVCRHHSKKLIVERLDAIVREVTCREALRERVFSSLKQKRLELDYEEACADSYESVYHGGQATRMMDERLVSMLKRRLRKMGVEEPRVLDVGCGPGSLTGKLLDIPGIRLTGVDLSPAMISLARKRYPGAQFYVDDIEWLSFPDETFDAVFCSGVLHHLPVLDMALAEIRRVLKPGGVLIVREPNEKNFSSLFPELAFAHLCLRHYLMNALGARPAHEPEAPEFHRSFDYDELPAALSGHFMVDALHADMMVSYFYDMLTDERVRKDLRLLEQTLSGLPGLHLVVIAAKDDRTGISDEVRQKIADLRRRDGLVDIRHLDALEEFAGKMFSRHKAEFFEYVARASAPGRFGACFRLHHGFDRILVAGDDVEQGQRVVRQYIPAVRRMLSAAKVWLVGKVKRMLNGTVLAREARRYLSPLLRARRGGRVRDVRSAAELSFADAGRYDMGVFLLTQPTEAGRLVNMLKCVRDYGLIYIEIADGVIVSGMSGDHEIYLDRLTLLSESTGGADGRPGLFLSRDLFSPVDFYRAFMVALEKQRDGVTGDDLARTEAMIERVKRQLAERGRHFSSLEFDARSKSRIFSFLHVCDGIDDAPGAEALSPEPARQLQSLL